MNIRSLVLRLSRKLLVGTQHLVASILLVAGTATAAQAEISQQPLFLGGGNVPGNLFLVPSVEWPTINGVANLGNYDSAQRYVGYFDAGKCYAYHYALAEPARHFYPVASPSAGNCTGEFWSGNYLNWAATQTIDPFRLGLTGGLRVVDTPSETWLEKARHTGQGDTAIYPNRRLPASGSNSALVGLSTPANWNHFQTRIQGLGNRMRFTQTGNLTGAMLGAVVAYDPAVAISPGTVYEVSVRVKVCDAGAGLEANCVGYSGGYKPEGLLQRYANDVRFSVFGYLNDSNGARDGAVLRARQKFVGPTKRDPELGLITNPQREWDLDTGVLIQNPDAADASATSSAVGMAIANSGVINYLNRFGQMTNLDHKGFDPVSELYYAGLRYLRGLDNVATYSALSGTATARYNQADGFPVITNWTSEDPVQYACQKNVLLGIGDIYTHRDKNLPGNTTFRTNEPAMPTEVAADTDVDVIAWTNRVGQMEGIGNIGSTNAFTGRFNSAYMAGLAYFANVTDLRPDLPGRQTASTYWIDVLEAQSLERPARNQFILAAKYGGFSVPQNFDPIAWGTAPLPTEWWHTNGQTLTTFGPRGGSPTLSFPRPDNFFLAGQAAQMVESLEQAFAGLALELRGTASSVAANSTRVDSDTAIYQALFDSRDWNGDLLAFQISTEGEIAPLPAWSAAQRLDALTNAQIATRRIFTSQSLTAGGNGSLRSTSGIDFQWSTLDATQRDLLRSTLGSPTLVSTMVGQSRLDYLRGDRSEERSSSNPSGPFRQRGSRLGDIVNSDPQFIHRQDFGYSVLQASPAFSSTSAGIDYITFRQSAAYQARPPVVIVGANDGMLHGFDARLDANGGRELFAYVPNAALPNLYQLTLQNYAHRYYTDGTPRVADAWLGAGTGWRTVAVGTTGAGGRGIFALDITNPETMTAGNVLWEFSHPDMGLTIGQPAIVALANGRFGVIVTSGYETGGTDGAIWFLDAANGEIIHRINVPGSGELGSPLVVDLDRDRVADRVYVGDSEGKLWRFDITGDNLSEWRAPPNLRSGSAPLPLFVARDEGGNVQPITGSLTSAFNRNGEHMVFFGTGSFIRVDDNVVPVIVADREVQSFYGLVDRGQQILNRGNLQQQEIITEQIVNGNRVRGVSDNEISLSQQGWYLDLLWPTSQGGPGPRGERVVSRALIRGDRVIFSTLIPSDDPCDFGGDSYIMELNAFSGARLFYAVFDLDGDGRFDENDFIEVIIDGETVRIPASGIAPGVGIIRTPAVISGIGENRDETKCVAGSSGALVCISEAAAFGAGRQSWQQLR
jgi:type IV pilus assembly protein PilY1